MNEYKPDIVSRPGDTIREMLEQRNMTQLELARRMGVLPNRVTQILCGRLLIKPEMAVKLERVLGVDARFWLHREADYRLHLLRNGELK